MVLGAGLGSLACLTGLPETGVLGISSGIVPSALAHRIQAADSEVVLLDETGTIEVVHRIFLHDLEQALALDLGRSPKLERGSPDARLAVERIAEAFALSFSDGRALPLRLVGAELDADWMILYQEAKPSGDDWAQLTESGLDEAGLLVRNRILMDVFDGQVNRVNIVYRKSVRTIVFQVADPAGPKGLDGTPAQP